MEKEHCTWTENDEGCWDTECDEMFILIDSTPEANNMNFCCYCGKPLVQKNYEEEDT
jgi:hypothetical protein